MTPSPDIGTKALSALRWAASLAAFGQLYTWAVTIIVIRLLSPADYGLMAMAMILVSFLMLINELGFGAVIVQREHLSDAEIGQIYGLTIVINFVFAVGSFAFAPTVAWFFGEPALTNIVRALSIMFVLAAFEVLPIARLEKELNFRVKASIQLVSNVTGVTATLLMALNGLGVWALIAGSLVAAALRTILVNIFAAVPVRPSFRLERIGSSVRFGGLVTLERVLWYIYSQADYFFIGKILGKEALGYYSVGIHLASLIMQKTGGIIYEVGFPSFARLQRDIESLKYYFLKAVRLMAFLSFPVFLGLSSIADQLVAVLFGDKWAPAVIVLLLTSMIMPLRMIANLFPPVLQGIGLAGESVRNLMIASLIMPAAFVIGTTAGIAGVSTAWLVAFPLVFVMMALRTGRHTNVRLREFLSAIAAPAVLSGLMMGGVYAFKALFAARLEPILALSTSVLAGALFFLVTAHVFAHDRFQEALGLIRRGPREPEH